MKKFILFILAISGMFSQLFAQTIPNSGLETWNAGEPQGWISTNAAATGLGGSANVTEETVDFHSGAAAAKLQTVQGSVVLPGAIASGTVSIQGFSSISPAGGFPYTLRSQTFTGYYKYTPATGDSCLIQAWLFNRNPNTHKRDTIAAVTFKDGNTVSTYTQFSVNFTYLHPGSTGELYPDSALILVCSSHALSLSGGKVGSVLLIDDLAFSGNVISGTNDITKNNTLASLYPNPASSVVTFKLNSNDAAYINIYNILGKKVKTTEVKGLLTSVSVNDMDSGLYFYQLATKEEHVISTGKFSVKK